MTNRLVFLYIQYLILDVQLTISFHGNKYPMTVFLNSLWDNCQNQGENKLRGLVFGNPGVAGADGLVRDIVRDENWQAWLAILAMLHLCKLSFAEPLKS